MPTNVDMQVRINPAGLASSDLTWTRSVTAVDDISIDLAQGAADQLVNVQPGPATAIEFILISCPADATSISYSTAPASPAIPLAGSHLYSGPGMAALLGANPTALYFSNASANDIAIRIIVGRNA